MRNNVKMLGSSPNSMISRFCSPLLDLFYTKYSNTRLNLYVIIFCCWHLVHTEQHACFVSPNLHFHKKKYFMQKYQRRKINMLATQHSTYTVGQKIKKKSMPKKLVKSKKSITRIFLGPNSIFCNFKIGQKSIFEVGKILKLPIMQFHEKNF